MAHMATLLAQTIAFQNVLDEHNVPWIKKQAEDFAHERLSRDSVRAWFSITISDPVRAPREPGFDTKLNYVMSVISKMSLPSDIEMTHKLALAMAMMGVPRGYLSDYLRTRFANPEVLLKKPTLTQKETAKLFSVSGHTVFNWLRSGKLSRRGKRVVNDSKLVDLYRAFISSWQLAARFLVFPVSFRLFRFFRSFQKHLLNPFTEVLLRGTRESAATAAADWRAFLQGIKAFREETGLSQMALAQRSGVSRARLQMAEAGYITLRENELTAIQRVFNAEIHERAIRFKTLLAQTESVFVQA
jgi:DNA-binding transcriptional regulator YiaG